MSRTTLKIASLTLALALVFGMLFGAATPASAQDNPDQYPLLREVANVVVNAAVKATGLSEGDLLRELMTGKPLAAIVKEKNADLDAMKAEVVVGTTEVINKAVAEGKLSQEQADQVLGRLDTLVDRMMRGGTLRAALSNIGNRPGMMAEAREIAVVAAQTLADTLGMTVEEIAQEVAAGKSLSDLIAEKGKTTDEVRMAVEVAVKAELDSLVAEGKLSQEQADKIVENLEKLADEAIQALVKRAQNPGDRAMMLLQGRAVGSLVAETAKQSNVTQREVLAMLREDKTLTQIAGEKGADPARIVEATEAALTAQIDRLVTNNRVTAEQAATFKAGLRDTLNKIMETANPLRNPMGRR